MGTAALLILRAFFGRILAGLRWCVEHWKIVMPILVVLVTVWYIRGQQERIAEAAAANAKLAADKAESDRTAAWNLMQAEAAALIAKQNADAVVALQAELKRQGQIAADADAKRRKVAADLKDLERRIADAPPEQDGPIPALLCDVLNQLRKSAGAEGPGCLAGDTAREGGSAAPGTARVYAPPP